MATGEQEMLIPLCEIIKDSNERNTKVSMLKRAGFNGTLVELTRNKYDNSKRNMKVLAFSIYQVKEAARRLKNNKNASSWVAVKAMIDLHKQMLKYDGVMFDLKGNQLPQLSNKHKQILLLATQYIYSFLQDAEYEHKDVKKLNDTLCKLSLPFIHDLPTQLDYAFKYLHKITGDEEIVCNELALGVNMAFMIAELNIFNPKLNKSILDKANKISVKLEQEVGHEEGYKNSLRITRLFTKDML